MLENVSKCVKSHLCILKYQGLYIQVSVIYINKSKPLTKFSAKFLKNVSQLFLQNGSNPAGPPWRWGIQQSAGAKKAREASFLSSISYFCLECFNGGEIAVNNRHLHHKYSFGAYWWSFIESKTNLVITWPRGLILG